MRAQSVKLFVDKIMYLPCIVLPNLNHVYQSLRVLIATERRVKPSKLGSRTFIGHGVDENGECSY